MIADLLATSADVGADGFRLSVRFEPAVGTVEASSWSYLVEEPVAAVTDRSVLPALPAAYVLACRLSQDLRVHEPLPPAVHRGAAAVGALLSSWYGWRAAELIAPVAEDPLRPPWTRPRRGHGVYFTRGVDSWSTVLRLLDAPPDERVTHLVAVDNEVHIAEPIRQAAIRDTRAAADDLGLPLIVVRTDVRAALDPHTDWGSDTHGSVFAGIGWLLRRSLDRIAMSPTNSGALVCPWGSHPDLERHWSLPELEVEHREVGEPRWVRTLAIADDPRVERSLQVCWQGASERNCGRCEKCLRLRTTLELGGRQAAFADRFDVPWDPALIDELAWSNAQAWADLIDHCDAVGLEADALRQRWERIPRRVVRGRGGAPRSVQPRVPVSAPPSLLAPAARQLARLGLRVDHGAPPRTMPALVVGRRGRAPEATPLVDASSAARSIPLAELRLEDLHDLLGALGLDPADADPFPSHDRSAAARQVVRR